MKFDMNNNGNINLLLQGRNRCGRRGTLGKAGRM